MGMPVSKMIQPASRNDAQQTPRLRYAIVVPGGGGKTSLCDRDTRFFDLDELYNLKQTKTTCARINEQLVLREQTKTPIPACIIDDLLRRINHYAGSGDCLLIHTFEVARMSGLKVLAVMIPTKSFHEISIAERGALGRWWSRKNREAIIQECEEHGLEARSYGCWKEFDRIIEESLHGNEKHETGDDWTTERTSNRNGAREGAEKYCVPAKGASGHFSDTDEEYLTEMLASTVGCHFETTSTPRCGTPPDSTL